MTGAGGFGLRLTAGSIGRACPAGGAAQSDRSGSLRRRRRAKARRDSHIPYIQGSIFGSLSPRERVGVRGSNQTAIACLWVSLSGSSPLAVSSISPAPKENATRRWRQDLRYYGFAMRLCLWFPSFSFPQSRSQPWSIDWFLRHLRRLAPASPSIPAPRSRMVPGSGTLMCWSRLSAKVLFGLP